MRKMRLVLTAAAVLCALSGCAGKKEAHSLSTKLTIFAAEIKDIQRFNEDI